MQCNIFGNAHLNYFITYGSHVPFSSASNFAQFDRAFATDKFRFCATLYADILIARVRPKACRFARPVSGGNDRHTASSVTRLAVTTENGLCRTVISMIDQ